MQTIQLHLTIPDQSAVAVYSMLEDAALRVDGSWSCVDDGAETALTLAACFDLGATSQAGASEPRVAMSLIDDTVARLAGLFEGKVRVDDVVIQMHSSASASRLEVEPGDGT